MGIAFPVYFLDMPGIVREFVQKLRFTGKPYIFGIATCGERPGGALFSLKALLEEKGTTLSAGFAFVMPENYIGPVDLMGDAGHRQEKYAAAQSRIPAVAEAIRERKQAVPEGNGRRSCGSGDASRGRLQQRSTIPPPSPCNGEVQPVPDLRTDLPDAEYYRGRGCRAWGKTCTQCYACIHWCPKGAIEIGGRTAGKPRYHHPDVTLADMLHQRGDCSGQYRERDADP